MFRICLVMFLHIFILSPVNSEVLDKNETKKLLENNPKIIGSIVTNRSLQIWILSSDKGEIIWCETFVNEDKVKTETICFDDVDPDN